MKTDQLVRITWIDAHAVTDGWTGVDELDDEPCVVTSVGLLLPETKPGHVVLAQSWIEDTDDLDGVLAIPLGMVRRIDTLQGSALLPIEPSSDR